MTGNEREREILLGSRGRKAFWDVLSTARGFSKETRDMVLRARPPVKQLCRLRTVGDESLEELRTNALRFSSPPFYDDPLDTFFYVDKSRLKAFLGLLSNLPKERILREARASLLSQAGVPGLDKLLDIMTEAGDGEPLPQFDQLSRQIDSARQLVRSVGYSLCFCDNPLNEALWLKYADRHKGFAQVYDVNSPAGLLCGKGDGCGLCVDGALSPAPYPVYYSDEGYDATRYAIALLLLGGLPGKAREECPEFVRLLEESIRWEFEKVTLIKRRQHEYDCEWRLLCRASADGMPSIRMTPSSVVLGLRMEDDDRRVVVDAARTAGVRSILQVCINEETGTLATKPYCSAG